MKEKKVCKVCGGKHLAKGYCKKHYEQVRKYGKIIDGENHRKGKPNDVIYYNDYIELILTDKYGNECGRTKIDIEDIKLFENKRVSKGTDGYIFCRWENKLKGIHRIIMNCPDNKVVDHINGDPSDNRKCNLRICAQLDNVKNRKSNINNTSGCKGVSWNKCNKAWEVKISKDGKRYYLGMYKDKEEAIKVRKEAEKKYFGEYNRGD